MTDPTINNIYQTWEGSPEQLQELFAAVSEVFTQFAVKLIEVLTDIQTQLAETHELLTSFKEEYKENNNYIPE